MATLNVQHVPFGIGLVASYVKFRQMLLTLIDLAICRKHDMALCLLKGLYE